MPPALARPPASGWTLMLADVVALLLAFFVLSFAMRDPLPMGGATAGPSDPILLVPSTAATLNDAEQPAAAAPPLAYLAAVIAAERRSIPQFALAHDDVRLSVLLPSWTMRLPAAGSGGPHGVADERDGAGVLYTMAFLARRYGMKLAVTVPLEEDVAVATQVARLVGIRDHLAGHTGIAGSEITFPATPSATGGLWRIVLEAVSRDDTGAAARDPGQAGLSFAGTAATPGVVLPTERLLAGGVP